MFGALMKDWISSYVECTLIIIVNSRNFGSSDF